jgi:glyoxylase-like metal-dependent hydrolase (beta-lactamase superfamily II)
MTRLRFMLSGCHAIISASAVAAGAPPHLKIVKLDSGVFAAIRTEPMSLALNANSLIIVRDSDVVVVDAQFTREATRETIAEIRKLTRKPVSYVINTHWHDDHLAGDQVYQDSFPQVRFVMQENTAADVVALGAPNRKGQIEGAPPVADRFEHLLSMGLGLDSTPASPGERAALETAIRIVRQYVAEAPGFRAVAATDTVQRRMTLGEGVNRIELLWFGYGNTRGDLIVHLPERGIVATGDLVDAPIPLAFNSYPDSWVRVLDSIVALDPKTIVPGHGPILHNLSYVRSMRDWLGRINRETAAVSTRGDSLKVALETVTLDDVRREVTGDEKWLNFLFRSFFVTPAVEAVYRER